MPSFDSRPSRAGTATTLASLCLALWGIASPAEANVVPASFIYMNVRPATWEYCTTSIYSCEQMHASTDAQGYVEFQIFIQSPTYYPFDPATRLTADLYWPDTWWLVDGSFCGGGTGSLEGYGGNPHRLEVDWPCEEDHNTLFLGLTLVLWVDGYGRLAVGPQPELWVGCPPETDMSWPDALGAEASTGCEYTDQPCAYFHYECEPGLPDELALETVPGGTVEDRVEFGASWGHGEGHSCHGAFHANTGEAWCTGRVENGDTWSGNVLVVTADASDLEVGTYHTWIQVESTGWSVARCLDLTLEVAEPTAVSTMSWGRLKTVYR